MECHLCPGYPSAIRASVLDKGPVPPGRVKDFAEPTRRKWVTYSLKLEGIQANESDCSVWSLPFTKQPKDGDDSFSGPETMEHV